MADVVNATHKSALSVKNQEPSHIAGKAPYEVLGGPGVSDAPGGDAYKIDATKGVGTDTTIPKSVPAEPSHLKTEGESEPEPEVSVDFGEGDEVATDDIDKELDEFEDIKPADVDVSIEDDKLKKEEFEKGENPFAKKDDEEKVDEEDENPFKDGEEEGDKKPVSESQQDGEEDGVEKVEEEDEDKKDDEEEITESLKVRLKMPAVNLFESAGIPAKSQKKFGVILESVVKDISKQITEQVHAHYKKLHEQKLAKRDAILTKQVDGYLSYVVEEWAKANRLAVRQSLRAQLAEEFMGALRKVFVEHYVDVPESKVDVVAKLTEQVNRLKAVVNEQVAQKMKLRTLAISANKARIVAESAEGLSAEQKAKLKKLAESAEYTTAKDFRGKLALLKENYFGASKPADKKLKTLPEEQVITEEKKVADKKSVDPIVNAIADTLTKVAQRDSAW